MVSVPAWNRCTWNLTHLLPFMFATPDITSYIAVFILARYLVNVLLGPVGLVPISCNHCHPWCSINSLNSLYFREVTWWILYSRPSITLCWLASDHVVAAGWTQFRHTWHSHPFVVVTVSALYIWMSLPACMPFSIHFGNGQDLVANCSCTFTIANFNRVNLWIAPFVCVSHMHE